MLGPDDPIVLESAIAKDGPYATLVTTKSDHTSGLTLEDGTALYAWKIKTTIPKWSAAAGGQRQAFVRGNIGTAADPAYVLTYDNADVSPIHKTWFECINTKAMGGTSTIDAAKACKSNDYPSVRILAPAVSKCSCEVTPVYVGDVTIDPDKADKYQCLVDLTGKLTVSQGLVTVPLPKLKAVHGDVRLDYRSAPQSPYATRKIQMPALEKIEGSLTFEGEVDPTFAPVPIEMDKLSSLGGALFVKVKGPSLVFSGLPAITELPGDVSIELTGDTLLANLLPALGHIHGNLSITTFTAMSDALPGLLHVDGNVSVTNTSGNDGYVRADNPSLSKLSTVGGNVTFKDLRWAIMAAPLAQVGGKVDFSGTSFTKLPGGPSGVQAASLSLVHNFNLTALPAASFAIGGAGPITIKDNPQLKSCEVAAFIAHQQSNGWNGVASASGNNGSGACP